MAIPRIMGVETEYGITAPGSAEFNPVLASSLLINSYISQPLRRIRWNYDEESPLRDARGYEHERDPSAPSDEDLGLANAILTNGARYYVDHAHPEYSTPECTNPHDVVVHDKAGERVLELSMERAAEGPAGQRILVYKNNTDGKGVSYGTHENYLVDRAVPFARIAREITPFFVTRQIYLGAGLLGGLGPKRAEPFQISQRADFFEAEVGLETTLKRPIVNTRDEPHADPDKYRRLHVIIGDANMSEVAIHQKIATTAIVLMMIEDEAITEDLFPESPVQTLRAISHDPSCRETFALKNGRRVRAVDVQWAYHEMAQKYLARHEAPAWTAGAMARWEKTLAGIESDPMSLASTVDWVAKYQVLSGFREKHGMAWDDPKLHMMDLQYHDVRRSKGLSYLLERAGKLERLVSDEEIERAVTLPPRDTRAYFRGRALSQFPKEIAAASWDSVIFDVGGESLRRVPMMEPLRGTEAHVRELFERSSSAAELLDSLGA